MNNLYTTQASIIAPISDLTAIVLCGGKGTRLKPTTDTVPKPMILLNGEPLLAYLLKSLSAYGLKRFVLCVGYKAELIEKFAERHRRETNCEVTCVNSGDTTMTHRLADARRYVNGRALICYGDTLANVDLNALQCEHESNKALATLTVYPMHSPFGIVSFNSTNRIIGFNEKPQLPYWINIGFILCEPNAFDYLKPELDMPGFLSSLSDTGNLHAYKHCGKHLTINNEKERVQAESEVIEFLTVLDQKNL